MVSRDGVAGKTWMLALLLAACGDNDSVSVGGAVAVTGQSPFPSGCNGAPQPGLVYPGMEVEPAIAVDPADDSHLVVAWQQDRWSNGGANGIGTAASFDGGATWTNALPAFAQCEGGAYERTSDPWLAIAPDGTTYAVAISFDMNSARTVVLGSISPDGGRTWGAPTVLINDDDPDVLNDKESITADGEHAYAVWDRLTGLLQPTKPVGTGATMMARATAGAWEPARAIYDPGVDNQTIGNTIAVLPDGTLVDVFEEIHMTSSNQATATIAVVRSTDHGDTWSAPITIAPAMSDLIAFGAIGVRDGAGLPAIAADPTSNSVYVAWEDNRFGGDGVAVARSRDGGLTWDEPVQANGAPDSPAFTAELAVAPDGTVGASYYDFRDGPSRASMWLATSSDGGQTWTDERLSRPFDLGPSLINQQYYFLGDYTGLAARADGFAAVFGVAFTATDPTEIFVRP
jgi:hypothetical protein